MANAAQGGRRDMIDYMLKLGAKNYNWAMENAARGGHLSIVEYMVELGVTEGTWNATDYNWALTNAANEGYINVVEYILKLGVTNCNNAILSAKRKGYEDIVKLIEDYQRKNTP